MLEDLETIDMVIHEPGQWVKFVVIDSGEMRKRDRERHLELLNHKVSQCIAMIEDDTKFDQLGRPEDITVEVRCAYPVQSSAPLHRSVTFESGRVMDFKIVFVERGSIYG